MSQGIFGLIDFSGRMDSPNDLTDKMGAFLRKNGGGKGEISYQYDNNYVLGMKRICHHGGYQQTQIAQNRELQALCLIHGEINNYENLVQEFLPGDSRCEGDLDLVLHLYRNLGPQFARKINGLFSLAILDQSDSSFILLNDRFGMAHQVYWVTIGSRFYFATHLKTLLTFPEIRKEIDVEALNLFLKYSYIPSPWTIFKGIRKLPPGHLLVFKNGKANVNAYWEFISPDHHIIDTQEAISIYKQLLKNSISKRLANNGGVGILLSGGLDSSANVALAAQCTQKKIKTFSVGFDDSAFDERPYAQIVSKHFNTEHYETSITGKEIEDLPQLIWHLEEPYFEFGLFLTYAGLAAAQKEVDIVLGGEGADQLFGTGGFAGGLPAALRYLLIKYHLFRTAKVMATMLKGNYFYQRDNWAFKFRLLLDRVIDLNNWYFYGYDENELRSLHKNSTSAYLPKIFSDNSNTQHPNTEHFSFADFFCETQINQDLKHYVNENVMVKSGRMADMLDLTLRESYLDTEVTDFLVSLDYHLKRSGDLFNHLRGAVKTKFLHRKAMEGLLPTEVMTKPKQGGFVPVMIFLKNPEMRKRIYRHLLNSAVMKEYFKTDYLKALFENYEGVQGKKIYWHNFYNSKSNRILFLLTFDIWHHFYINNNPIDVTLLPLSEHLNLGSAR
jgi:asparagine synthase (glutamine-hydrolysing)